MTGRLHLVATPIGNLGDLSPRAVATLQACALICCEDTRHSGSLLAHAGVSGVRLAIANEHTEMARVDEVLGLLAAGNDVAVITDAGTPGISDPGARLVRAAIDAGQQVTAVPGPAALVMALVVSGFDSGRFVFEGFLPRSGRDRAERVGEVATERRTVVLYEAPHRLGRTLTDLREVCGGDRRIAVTRELTKKFEEVWRGTLDEAVEDAATRAPRGEYVLVLEGAPPADPADDDVILAALRAEVAGGADRRSAVATVMSATGAPKRRVYDLSLQLPR